jgi:hypothetical protein
MKAHRYRVPAPPVLVAREEPHLPEGVTDWREADERLRGLAKERAGHERLVCHWLVAAERLALPQRVGYAGMVEYGERVLGLSRRQTEERLRVGRALVNLPLIDTAFAAGALSYAATRELTRLATPEVEGEWVEWAADRRVREIERAVAMRRPGDKPSARPDATLLKHRIGFEVRAETLALFRDLLARVRNDLAETHAEEDIDEDMVLFEVARRALGGPDDDGRASYQVAVVRCEVCGETSIDAGGATHVVDETFAEMVECDAQTIDVRPAGPHAGAEGSARRRATQTIPPMARREVVRRDRRRCKVPGCSNHRYLDVHHIDTRADGGGHDPERLVLLCGPHHRAHHAGALQISGSASTGFTFRHADGTPYGEASRPAGVDAVRQAIVALRKMGFKDSEARALVAAARSAGAPDELAALLLAALRAA